MNDEIFFNQSKYIGEMLKKFGMENSKVIKTPMSRKRALTLDKDSESIDSTKYRGMIGSLLYLTTSMPDIMFSVYLCAIFQEDPKDHAGDVVDRKTARRACQQALWIKQAFVDYNITLNEDKIKEPLSPRLNEDEYFICCENTTHMMNALKETRMKNREMFLSIHHSLKMLLDIISKMNIKLEDEKIKRNDKGKEKVNDF
nr:hypothetical protein [Tanacetum cinerariifolium]